MERPDGSQATVFGWILVVVGMLAVLVAAGAETYEGLVWGAVVANLGIGLGIILLSLGYLVRAIWFLPGREIKSDKVVVESEGSSGAYCDWCHLWVGNPGLPCSHSDAEQIEADAKAALEKDGLAKACQYELVKRGFLEQ